MSTYRLSRLPNPPVFHACIRLIAASDAAARSFSSIDFFLRNIARCKNLIKYEPRIFIETANKGIGFWQKKLRVMPRIRNYSSTYCITEKQSLNWNFFVSIEFKIKNIWIFYEKIIKKIIRIFFFVLKIEERITNNMETDSIFGKKVS